MMMMKNEHNYSFCEKGFLRKHKDMMQIAEMLMLQRWENEREALANHGGNQSIIIKKRDDLL